MYVCFLFLGFGSIYIYGYCDVIFKFGMLKEECFIFVLNGM